MFAVLFFGLLGLLFVPYAALHVFCAALVRSQDLKKKYNAQWALVTGASSGIGKSIAKRLAEQGLNIVLVSLPDALLDDTSAELQKSHPTVQIRKVGTDLGKQGYIADIEKATKDIDVQIVFLNAGYMVTGFFHDVPLEKHVANVECNIGNAYAITHFFLARLLQKKLRGCFVYTSSAAAVMPSPFSSMYAATKCFLSSFACSLAAEVKSQGIDVMAFHPSPVATRFYDKAHKLDMLDFFKAFAVQPDALPDTVFASIGYTALRDVGATAIILRCAMKLVDLNTLAVITANLAPYLPDYKRQLKALQSRKKAA